MKMILPLLIIFLFGCTHQSSQRSLSALPDEGRLKDLVGTRGEKCNDLVDKITGMKTNGFSIERDGKTLWEYYDKLHGPNTPHVLWSASKTLTTTLVGIAVKEGKLNLKTPLRKAFKNLEKAGIRSPSSKMYEIDKKATIETLVTMTYPYRWNEFYESDVTNSTFMPMLYLEERYNMPRYAYAQPYDDRKTNGLSIPPNEKTVYSGGNSNLLQYLLREAYGEEEYKTLPWKKIFEPLGMEQGRWERDESGYFVGSSYAYASVPDMLKYGRFYLNDGVTQDGKRLLSSKWVEAAQTKEKSLGSDFTPEVYTRDLGIQSQRVFWLNQPVYKNSNPKKRIWPTAESDSDREFPNSPSDMFFAAGHYGQLIIMLPSENMVIARIGHDLSYWGEIDDIVSSTINCFSK